MQLLVTTTDRQQINCTNNKIILSSLIYSNQSKGICIAVGLD